MPPRLMRAVCVPQGQQANGKTLRRQRKAIERCGSGLSFLAGHIPRGQPPASAQTLCDCSLTSPRFLQRAELDPRTCPSRNSFAKALRYFRGNSVQIPSRVCQHSLPSQRSCRGASALLTRMLIGEVEQSTDALGGGGMAAKQAHRIMPECRHRHWRRAGGLEELGYVEGRNIELIG